MTGFEVFSLVQPPARNAPKGATRRQIANAALIRHHQKPLPSSVRYGTLTVWERYVAWQLEWENEILRYRDGNNGEAERTNDG